MQSERRHVFSGTALRERGRDDEKTRLFPSPAGDARRDGRARIASRTWFEHETRGTHLPPVRESRDRELVSRAA